MVIQCALEWPSLRSMLGVELSHTRHATAVAAHSRDPQLLHKVQLIEGDMLAVDLSDVDVLYVASLLFDDEFMGRLGGVLARQPRLRAVASLTPFPPDSLPGFSDDPSNFGESADMLSERVEVTWGAARTYVYRRTL